MAWETRGLQRMGGGEGERRCVCVCVCVFVCVCVIKRERERNKGKRAYNGKGRPWQCTQSGQPSSGRAPLRTHLQSDTKLWRRR